MLSIMLRGATGITLQPHQILRQPRNMHRMLDPHHICNVIYNARSNKHHPPTWPTTAPATQHESHEWSASHMQRHLQCAEQQSTPSNLTKYCACHAKWMSWLSHITHATSFTMRRATVNTFQPHQILRLPRKMNVMIEPHHRWNVIFNARSNRHHPATSPNTAPATQYASHAWSASHMQRLLQCAEQQASPSNLTKYCACHATWISWVIRITYATSFTMRRATVNTFQPHQILRLPRKMNVMIEPHHRWNVIYNARSNSQHLPTSPNTAPATQNECHDWATSQMKRHLQCAEQQATPSNLTKYCACHAKWPPNIWQKFAENRWNVMIEPHHRWNVIFNARSNRQHPPTSPNTAPATQNDHPTSDRNLLKTGETSWLSHITDETSFSMRGATGITLQPQQILRQPRNMHRMLDPHHICNVIYNARSNKHHPPTWPNTAPATQHESHEWSASHMQRHLQCAEQQSTPSNLTKYCACHAKWMSWLSHITDETSFTMRGATVNTFQPHQILRLPRKMNVMIEPHHRWNVIYNARSNRQHPPTSPNTAPATQNDHPTSDRNLLKTGETSFPMRDRSDHDPRTIRERSDPENANRNPPRHRGYFSHSPGADSIENYNVSRSGYHSNFLHMLRLPRKVTHELLQMLRLPQKVQHERHQMVHLPRKVTHDLHQMLHLPQKVTRSDTWLLPLRLLPLLLLLLLLLGLLLLLLRRLLLGLLLLGLLLLGVLLLGLLRLLLLLLLLLLGVLLLGLLLLRLRLLGLLLLRLRLLGLLLLGLLLLGLLLLRLLLLGLLLLGLLLLRLLLLGLLLLGLLLLGLLLLGLLLLRLLLLGLLLLGLLLLRLLLLGLLLLGLLRTTTTRTTTATTTTTRTTTTRTTTATTTTTRTTTTRTT